MRIVLVGRKEGKRVVRWANYFALGLCLSLVLGMGMGAVFRLLSGRWSHGTALYGIAIGVGMMALQLIRGLTTPVDDLATLD